MKDKYDKARARIAREIKKLAQKHRESCDHELSFLRHADLEQAAAYAHAAKALDDYADRVAVGAFDLWALTPTPPPPPKKRRRDGAM